VEAPLPANAGATRDSEVDWVSCATTTWCTAVGDYTDSAGGSDGLIETYTGGKWSAVEAPVPADALQGATASSFLKSISCQGVNECSSFGVYRTAGGGVGLIDSLSGDPSAGQWSAQAAPQPAGAAAAQQVILGSVSCPSEGGCAATGIYDAAGGGTQPEVFTQASEGGPWTVQDAPLPPDAATGTNLDGLLFGVSCSAGVCEAAGEYAAAGPTESGVLERFSGGVWTATEAPLPGNAGTGSQHGAALQSVSCALDGCVAVGEFEDTAGHERPLAVTVSATGALAPAEAAQPADAATTSSADLEAVSCLSVADCAAGGTYATSSAGEVGLLDSLSGSTWTPVGSPVPANGATGSSAQSTIQTVACSSRGACEAGGQFSDSSANAFGLLDSYTPPEGYWSVASDGGIFNYGTSASFHGSMGGQHLNAPMVGMASTPGGGGYWEVGSDGGIFSFGNAAFHGSTGSLRLNKPIVGMAATPDGLGYWLVASDGGIFNYGDAGFFGSAGSVHLNKPIVGMAATPDGGGYWLVASDGGIFNYGDANFFGSAGSIHLNKPVVGMASDPSGLGYWLVASDGGIFTYGDAGFLGSRGGQPLNKPIVGMMSTFDGAGYWLTASDGGIFSYGDTGFFGSAGSIHLNAPVVSGTAS
jgi:hypothetical protein